MSRVDIITIGPDGTETVTDQHVKRKYAEHYAKGYNALTDVTGFRVELRDCPDDADQRRTAIVVIERPKDWNPTAPDEVPPRVSIYTEEAAVYARAFAAAFNRGELADPTGLWAIACDHEIEYEPTETEQAATEA